MPSMPETESAPAPQPRRWRKRLLFLLVLGVAFAAYQGILRSRTEAGVRILKQRGYPLSLAELDARYAAVPVGSNLAGPIARAARELKVRTSDRTNHYPYVRPTDGKTNLPSPVPAETLKAWKLALADNDAAWTALEEAEGRTQSRYPIDLKKGFNLLLPQLSEVKGLANACALRALIAAEEGDTETSIEALRDIYQCRRSLLSEPILISCLVGYALDSIGTRATCDCLGRASYTDSQLARLDAEIAFLAATNQLENALIGELAFGRSAFKGSLNSVVMAGGGLGTPNTSSQVAAVALDSVLRITGMKQADEAHFVRSMVRLIDAASAPCPRALDLTESLRSELVDSPRASLTRRFHIFSKMLLPSMVGVTEKEALDRANLAIARCAIAIERHRLANQGELPARLEDLVPRFLPETPLDPFDGQALRYRRLEAGYRIYSIGINRKDDGGGTDNLKRSERPKDTTYEVRIHPR